MKLNDLFTQTKLIDELLGGQLLEISVKQHNITISITEPLIYLPYAKKLLSLINDLDGVLEKSFISIHNDIIYFTFEKLSSEDIKEESPLYLFMKTIEEFADKICTCPSLEFIISNQYLKCFLDKPGLTVKSLSDYEDVLNAKGKGELELHPQRPYLLFINENFEV